MPWCDVDADDAAVVSSFGVLGAERDAVDDEEDQHDDLDDDGGCYACVIWSMVVVAETVVVVQQRQRWNSPGIHCHATSSDHAHVSSWT